MEIEVPDVESRILGVIELKKVQVQAVLLPVLGFAVGDELVEVCPK